MIIYNHTLSSLCQNKGEEMVEPQSQIEARYSSHASTTDKIVKHMLSMPLWNDSYHCTEYDHNLLGVNKL